MTDRPLLYDMAGRPARRILEGDDALRALLIEVFGRPLDHPKARPTVELLQVIEGAVTKEKIVEVFPDMAGHVQRRRARFDAEEATRGRGKN